MGNRWDLAKYIRQRDIFCDSVEYSFCNLFAGVLKQSNQYFVNYRVAPYFEELSWFSYFLLD